SRSGPRLVHRGVRHARLAGGKKLTRLARTMRTRGRECRQGNVCSGPKADHGRRRRYVGFQGVKRTNVPAGTDLGFRRAPRWLALKDAVGFGPKLSLADVGYFAAVRGYADIRRTGQMTRVTKPVIQKRGSLERLHRRRLPTP